MSQLTESLIERKKESTPKALANLNPIFIKESHGAEILDVEGNRFIDFTSGIGVNNVGNSHPAVVKAIKAQSDKFLHSCFHVVMYEDYVTLAEKLNQLVPVGGPAKTMFANSGAEAVENAVKIARCHTKKRSVICFDNAFHGRTMLTMTMTSKIRPNKMDTGAWAPGIFRVHFPYCFRCPWNLENPSCNMYCGSEYFERYVFKYQVDPDDTAAIILEPVQGEGGFIPVPQGYLDQLRQICDSHGIVLIYDEIQSGFGRTAKLFAADHFDAKPDIIVSAKSLGGGLPISAVTGKTEIMDTENLSVGALGGTYGGNPVACAAALAVLEVFETENLLDKARQRGAIIREHFQGFKERFDFIGDVRGLGAMQAMEIVTDRKTLLPDGERTGRFVAACRDKGLLILSCGTFKNNIRMLVPLSVDLDLLDEGLAIMESAFIQVS
ncbi:MAG: aspartate aminotransferase family protein [Desulfobacterium sp.]|nr:aspartate aminotransferase family protein [Desulfobacterium sp.]